MPVASGSRLGPYQIEIAIGAGGMGEDFRARATRLDGSVGLRRDLPSRVVRSLETCNLWLEPAVAGHPGQRSVERQPTRPPNAYDRRRNA